MYVVTNPSYLIRYIVTHVPHRIINDLGVYGEKFHALRTTLNNTKKKLDKYEKDKFYHSFTRNLYPYGKFKYIIQRRLKIPYITNAWLKTYQLLYTLKEMFPFGGTYTAFFNANAPGASSHAAEYFFRRHTHLKLKWVASTYIGGNDVLDDQYGLIKANKNKWLMDKDNNGDVRCTKNIKNFIEKIRKNFDGNLVNLYFSDIAIDIKQDYQREEFLEMQEVFGQNICGLMCLAPGGMMIVKQRSFLLPFNVWMLGEMSKLFHHFSIHKPSTSRSYNSEVYIVGIGYHGMPATKTEFMLRVLENFDHYRQIIPTPVNVYILKQLYDSATDFVHKQCNALTSCVTSYEKHRYRLPELYQTLSQDQAVIRQKFVDQYRIFE